MKLKSRIAKLKGISDKIKAKISPATIIKQSAENMNNVKSKKYGISPNGNEKNDYLANGLKHFSSLKEQNDQKEKVLIDLIDMIKKVCNKEKKIA